ncbi:MAG: nucleotidyltransferase family protein [Woeseiaceae bacterium]|nr:nucleotidyltransferase family protein [Woeseiaceae bacterium]
MLLAAGKGERLRPLTESVPKALVDVAGRSLIERHLDRLPKGSTVVINLGWLGLQIAERVGSGEKYGHTVVYSDEGENILETGGGIQRALPFLGDRPFLIVNADVLTDMLLPPDDVDLGDAQVHLVLVPKPEFRSEADFGLKDGRVTNDDRRYTYSGVAIYNPRFFAACKPGRFSVVPLLREAAEQGLVSGSLYTGYWSDVGTPERLEQANAREARA